MKRNLHQLKYLLFMVGFILCAYPLLSNILNRMDCQDALSTYQSADAALSADEKAQMLSEAAEYNAWLYQNNPLAIGSSYTNIFETAYEDILNPYGNGVMGSIEIPSIDVYLPIYHGTDADVLTGAAGHLEGSSLPIGGINTRAVLTGHRGSPSAKLFTRLDELTVDDLFYIRVLGHVLAYRVTEIMVVEPEDIAELAIIQGKDLVSLVTCTPYGINSHRLVITGERTDFDQNTYDSIPAKLPSIREIVFAMLPGVCVVTAITVVWRKKRKGDF